MIDDMGIFRTTLGISGVSTPQHRRDLDDVMVDAGTNTTGFRVTSSSSLA
jgi:hypothetical protein